MKLNLKNISAKFHLATTPRQQVVWIIVISTVGRLILASQLELGNDEVYYWTYALFPDLSHFDHPPMVGLLAQIFSLNLSLKDDFFLRLGPIFLSAINTWTIYKIGAKIKNETTGLYAAFLFTSSIYCSIVSGFALTPDAPEIFFWLLSLNILLDVLPVSEIHAKDRWRMILFGILAGMGILSKYHSIFLWLGVLLFIFIFNRKWLRDYSLYITALLSFIIVLPIIIWNFENNFIGLTFHANRVTPALAIRPDYFFSELLGQFAYNNPFNVILIISALAALVKGQVFMTKPYQWILIFTSLPLWIIFTSFSIFKKTLPHWTGPAYISLILMASAYWAETLLNKELPNTKLLRPLRITFPSYFLAIILIAFVYIINYAPFQFGKKSDIENFGENDFTQDMFGWHVIEKEFREIAKREESTGNMKYQSGLISYRWFPGAHLDFYVAWPNHRNLYLIGSLNDIHKYAWINEQRGGLTKGNDFYHIAVSNNFRDPKKTFGEYFDKIEPIDTLEIKRNNMVTRYAFFYRMKNYKGNFSNPLNEQIN